jgi:DNA modification methylase
MLFSDPPYNVDYAGTGENTSEGIANDNLSKEDFDKFINQSFANIYEALKVGAVFYVCSGWSSYPTFNEKLIENGFYRAGVIIWVKNNAAMGWNDFRYKHEWILVGKKKEYRVKAVSILYGWKKGSHYFRDTRDEYDVWEVPREHSKEYKHPTQKPVWLIEKALANSSERGGIVLDPFGGSGSTLIACERLKRKAFLMEYDPKYVDVIIERWEKFTNRKAVLL